MKPKSTLSCLLFAIALFQSSTPGFSQVVPVSLDQRVANSPIIAIATLKDQVSYWDQKKANIYTRNVLEVKAYLKGASPAGTIVAISPGGIVGNDAEYVCPSETYQFNTDYLVLLKANEAMLDDKDYRRAHPGVIQCLSYAGIQSVLPYEDGVYKDILAEAPMTEEQLLTRMRTSYGLEARQPNGSNYTARIFSVTPSQRLFSVTTITDGTGFLPATGFVNGTVLANNQLIINGSGFGATNGSVTFANINDGGATTTSTVANDIVSWSATQVRVKIPDLAGTGTLTVLDNGAVNVGTSPITIKWGEINVSQIFMNHASAQRQQVRLLNRNAAGGYTFEYSSNTGSGPAFSADAAAKTAFQRAVRTWRCSSFVNFNVNSNGSNAAGFANDNINIVMYDNVTLPAGALGVCTSRFNGNGSGGLCDLFNTVWYLKEMDIRVLSIPVPGFTWNFSAAAPTGSQYDFESVMLHEIGHGHGLTHINLSTRTMYYAIANGSMKRTLSVAEIEAGQHRITQSNANCLNTNGFAGFLPHTAVSPAVCNILLPLSLLDFSGQKHSGAIDLQWITEWEENVRGFFVERSTDGQNFKSIGYTEARGSAAAQHSYSFTDNNSFPVITYYRLRMENWDNSFTYSKIVSFKPQNTGWRLFPNPATENVYVVADKDYKNKVVLKLSDLSGKTILSQEFSSASAGVALPITVKKLIPGIYIIKVVSGSETLLIEKLNKR